jgi:hypothetical protein
MGRLLWLPSHPIIHLFFHVVRGKAVTFLNFSFELVFAPTPPPLRQQQNADPDQAAKIGIRREELRLHAEHLGGSQ